MLRTYNSEKHLSSCFYYLTWFTYHIRSIYVLYQCIAYWVIAKTEKTIAYVQIHFAHFGFNFNRLRAFQNVNDVFDI